MEFITPFLGYGPYGVEDSYLGFFEGVALSSSAPMFEKSAQKVQNSKKRSHTKPKSNLKLSNNRPWRMVFNS
jgi:hypothetical protein